MVELQQFHYGRLVHHGQPKGKSRVLAKSPGLNPKHAQAALNEARIPPLGETTSVAWGVVRLKEGLPACLTRAERGESGVVTRQFILLPLPVLKNLAGNVMALWELVNEPLPTYDRLGDDLPTLSLPPNPKPTTDEQVDSLLGLMTYTKNNTRKIEPLLAGVVSGLPLVVTHAPPDGKERAQFVQGMLSLLPASTRFGISFLLHSTPDTALDANIMFMDTPPEQDAVIYNWESGDISGADVDGDYSRFIIGQLRLDAELVTQQTEKLTPTAGWRFSSGDSLAQALDYASYRSKVDRSIENNMPIDSESVSEILTDDPTLPDELRVRYARHVLNFALAMDEVAQVTPLAAVMQTHSDFEDEVYDRLTTAIDDGDGRIVFGMLVNWMSQLQHPTGARWNRLVQQAGVAALDDLAPDATPHAVHDFLDDVQSLGESASGMIPAVVDRVPRLVNEDADVLGKVLLLAIRFADSGRLQTMLRSRSFVQPLPKDIKRYLASLKRRDITPPEGTLVKAARQLGDQFRQQGVIQFAKLAYRENRFALIDKHALREIVDIMLDNTIDVDTNTMVQLAQTINDHRLQSLESPAPRLLLQILLKAGKYDWLASAMVTQSRDYYSAERQFDYIRSLQLMFKHTPLPADAVLRALEVLEDNGIRDIPMLAAMCGALESSRWSAALEPVAWRVIQELNTNLRYTQMIPAKTAMTLLRYYARQQDTHKLRVAARVVASVCAYKNGRLGLSAANRAYKMLNSHAKTQPVAMDVIRQFIREAADKPARHMMNYYSQKLDDAAAAKLQIAYEFSNMMGRLDLVTYADLLRTTVELLQHNAEVYQQAGNYPQLIDLRQQVERIRRDQATVELRELSENMRTMAHSLVILSEQHERRSSSDSAYLNAITKGERDPRSILDAMRAAGGYLLNGKTHSFHLQEDVDVSAPFGDLSPAELVDHVAIASRTLHPVTNARPTSRSMWTYETIVDELRSRVESLPESNDDLLVAIGRDWQRLADLVPHLVGQSNADVIQSANETGRRLERREIQPQSPLDLYRFVYGYFAD